MLQIVLTAGPLLAGTAALLALIANLTRGTRLSHRERMLRESMAVLEANSPHRTTVAELHLQTVAEIVARQSSGKWRFWWPCLVLLVGVAVMARIGYDTTRYFARGGTYDYESMVTEIGGGDPMVVVFPIFAVAVLPAVVLAYRHSLFDRATIARDFYSRGVLREPRDIISPLDNEQAEPDRAEGGWLPSAQARARKFARVSADVAQAVAPGAAAASVGIAFGIGVGLRQSPLDQRAGVLSAMGATPAIVTLSAALSITATLWAAVDWRIEFLKCFPRLPHPHKRPVPPGPIDYI